MNKTLNSIDFNSREHSKPEKEVIDFANKILTEMDFKDVQIVDAVEYVADGKSNVILGYQGDVGREDNFYTVLNESNFAFGGIKADITPIEVVNSDTIEKYLQSLKLNEEVSEINLAPTAENDYEKRILELKSEIQQQEKVNYNFGHSLMYSDAWDTRASEKIELEGMEQKLEDMRDELKQLELQSEQQVFKDLKQNAGYYILDETENLALGFSPTAPSSFAIWNRNAYGEYISGEYKEKLSLYAIADLHFAGIDTDKALRLLTDINFDFVAPLENFERMSQGSPPLHENIARRLISDSESLLSESARAKSIETAEYMRNYSFPYDTKNIDVNQINAEKSELQPHHKQSMNKPVVYVCSPLAGEIEANIRKAREYSKFVAKEGNTPIAPHITELFNDTIPEERELGLSLGIDYLRKADELWVFGDRISNGMAAEIKLAQEELHIPIYHIDADSFEKMPFLTSAQNDANQLMFKQSPAIQAPLSVGSIISVPVQFPGVEYKSIRTMLVVGTSENGDYICNNLTSKKPYKDNDKFQGNVFVAASDENGLKYDSYVKCDKQYIVPADTSELRITKARLTDETMAAVKATTDRLQDIQAVPITDNPPASISIDENINAILANFKTDPELFSEFTAFSAQFYDYSFRNKLLIFNQAPHSTFVASYTHWQELGYNVLRGEKGITIYRPIESTTFNRQGENIPIKEATNEEKAKIGRGEIKVDTQTTFIKHNVFDISQTSCPKEDYPKVYSMGYADIDKRTMYETVKDFAETSGFTVREEQLQSIALNGYCDVEHGSITINSRLEDSEKLSTMLHELAHGLMHKTSTQEAPVMEFEAEALSITLQHKFNLPIDDSSKNYLCNYYKKIDKNNFKPDQSFSRLSKAVKFVDKGVTDRLAEKGISLEQSKNISLDKQNIGQQASAVLSNQNFLQEL